MALLPILEFPDPRLRTRAVDVDPAEPMAANALTVGDVVIYPATFPRTLERLEQAGCHVRPLEVDELQKAEGAVTCCSLIFEM